MKVYSVLGLIFMMFVLPIIPATVIWWYLSPANLGCMIFAGMIAACVYILAFFVELFIILKVYE